MSKVIVHVRLLDEGTEVARPTEAIALGGQQFKLLATEDYDPEVETWEYSPGSIVRCEERRMSGTLVRLAVQGIVGV